MKKSNSEDGSKEKRILEVSSKELRLDLEMLQKDVKRAYDRMKKLIPESIKDVEIKPFGNASHVILPKEFAGKKATVIVKKD